MSFKKFLPGIAWFFVILVLIGLPGKEVPKIDWLSGINFDKVIHVGVFALLAVLFCWPFYRSAASPATRKSYFIKIALATSIWGLCTEFIQKFWIPGRSFDMLDWASDSLGSLIGYWISNRRFLKK